jgi:hypothetical protein
MSTPHRATEEQWEIVEICREEGHTPWPTATCLLELRSRVEALERRCEVQLQQLGDLQDGHHRLAGNVRLLEREVVVDQPEPEPPTLQESQASKAHYEAELARLKCEAMQQPASVAPPPLRCPGAHTIAECGGPCEDDFRLCDCGLLQQLNPKPPASKRLWEAMEEAGRRELEDNAHADLAEFYEAMIRAVADWLEARGNRGSATELREEASR